MLLELHDLWRFVLPPLLWPLSMPFLSEALGEFLLSLRTFVTPGATPIIQLLLVLGNRRGLDTARLLPTPLLFPERGIRHHLVLEIVCSAHRVYPRRVRVLSP